MSENVNSGIAEIIKQVKSELIKSSEFQEENDGTPLFKTEQCEIEIKCVVKEDVSVGGKVDLKLFAVNYGEDVSQQKVHSIKVTLKVPDKDDETDYDELPGLYHRK